MSNFSNESPDQTAAAVSHRPSLLHTLRQFLWPDDDGQGLGTFPGVYRPTILTILGVMMYLREGWVVGNAGLLGAILVILLTFTITGTAALSLSSITTNIRVGAGGVFSIISQSLGLEPGGSIGVPLYLGQALSSALYVYGFSEAWLYIFPHHNQMLVAYAIFLVVFVTTLISTSLAFRLQGLVMLVILASLTSIGLGLTNLGGETILHEPTLWGTFDAGGFWVLFAIFFPAGTGIKVGASMSGALKNPRYSIPRGTLAAVATALAVYILMAIWYSLVATPAELQSNFTIVVEKAAWGPLVLVGILASTFTATLSSLVAAPRVLQALGEHKIVPGHGLWGQLTAKGEPRNAALFTGGLVAVALLLGGLDQVAVLITMFFLLTYLTINIVILIEQSLGMISFRPIFRVSRAVPLVGTVACLIAIFVISPSFALIALILILAIYVYLVRRRLETPWQTVRSSIFVSLADWAAKQIARSPEEANERSWKPDLMVPVESRSQIDGSFRFLHLLTEPKGSVKIVGIRVRPSAGSDDSDSVAETADNLEQLREVAAEFRREGVFATSVQIASSSLLNGVQMSTNIMYGSYFRPNILFGLAHLYDQETLQGFVDTAVQNQIGAALMYQHPETFLGHERRINIWVSDRSPDWELALRMVNLDLALLLGYQLYRNWRGPLRLLTVCREPGEMENGRIFLNQLVEDARLPTHTECHVYQGTLLEQVGSAPQADLNLFGLAREVDKQFLETLVRRSSSSCLFVRDSGRESALA
jgi:solute carrier family 12 (potassium/chloride transporters), member 9